MGLICTGHQQQASYKQSNANSTSHWALFSRCAVVSAFLVSQIFTTCLLQYQNCSGNNHTIVGSSVIRTAWWEGGFKALLRTSPQVMIFRERACLPQLQDVRRPSNTAAKITGSISSHLLLQIYTVRVPGQRPSQGLSIRMPRPVRLWLGRIHARVNRSPTWSRCVILTSRNLI